VSSIVGAIEIASGIITPVESIISMFGVVISGSFGVIMLPDSVSEIFPVAVLSVTTGIATIVQVFVSIVPELFITIGVSVVISVISVVPVLFSDITAGGISEIVVFPQDIASAIQSNEVFSVTGS
jgi:hypothetical protein